MGEPLPRRELPVPIRSSLPLWLPVILAGGIAVAVGVTAGPTVGPGLVAIVGLVGLVLAALALLRPPTLVLDAEGMALRSPFGVVWRRPWAGCGEFRVWDAGTVVWESPAEAAAHPRRAAAWRRRAEADAAMGAQFGGLGAEALADLLNRYRTQP